MTGHQASARPRSDLVLVAVEAALVAAAAVVGAVLNHRRVPIHADAAPLYGSWLPHVGPGTPLALAWAAAVVCWGPGLAARLDWRRLLPVTYLAALGWTVSLALVDGWHRGIATRLTPQAEYLHDVPKVHGVAAMLRTFSDHIIDFQPGSWATHVAGHPPGAFLVFVVLDRLGLPGGVPAAALCVLVGATAPVSVAVALRALGNEPAARSAVPFLVLFPGAVWVGVSADGMFTGVVAAGLASLAIGGVRAGLAGGLLLGYTLYLSYGLVLVGALAAAVLWLRPAPRSATAIAGGTGVAAVVVAFTASGFWWPTGYHLVVRRYYQGWAADRPYGYWVWADLACLVLCAGPVLAPALSRLATTARSVAAPTVASPTVASPTVASPTVAAPTVASPTVAAPTVAGRTVVAPTTAGPTVAGPTVAGPTVAGPTVPAVPVAAPTAAAPTMAAGTVAAGTVAAGTVAAGTVAAGTVAARAVGVRAVAGRIVAARTVAGRTPGVRAVAARLAGARGMWSLPAAALLGILAADLSGLSKAEVERIWLPYALWLLVATAWLPRRHRRAWLIAQAATALAVNHLVFTGW